MNWAIIENGRVKNTIFADEEFIEKHYPDAIDITDANVGVNWLYDGKDFSAPPVKVEDEAETL